MFFKSPKITGSFFLKHFQYKRKQNKFSAIQINSNYISTMETDEVSQESVELVDIQPGKLMTRKRHREATSSSEAIRFDREIYDLKTFKPSAKRDIVEGIQITKDMSRTRQLLLAKEEARSMGLNRKPGAYEKRPPEYQMETIPLPEPGDTEVEYPAIKPLWVFNNHLYWNLDMVASVEFDFCYGWKNEVFAEGGHRPVRKPGDGRGVYLRDTNYDNSFYSSFRRLVGLQSMDEVIDNICVMIMPIYDTTRVCRDVNDTTIGDYFIHYANTLLKMDASVLGRVAEQYGLNSVRTVSRSTPEGLSANIEQMTAYQAYLRLFQQLLLTKTWLPVPTDDNPLIILLSMIHSGSIIAIWTSPEDYGLGMRSAAGFVSREARSLDSSLDDTVNERLVHVFQGDVAQWSLHRIFYPQRPYHINVKELFVHHLYLCINERGEHHYFPVLLPEHSKRPAGKITHTIMPNMLYDAKR
jgi:hypothetical protein